MNSCSVSTLLYEVTAERGLDLYSIDGAVQTETSHHSVIREEEEPKEIHYNLYFPVKKAFSKLWVQCKTIHSFRYKVLQIFVTDFCALHARTRYGE